MSISEQLINGFIKTELELFKKQFEESPVPKIQEERSLAIAWLCYYFKYTVSNENSSNIIQFVDEVYSRDDYNTIGWHRISALQASAFILNSDINYSNSILQHIDCGKSLARRFIIESLGIICPLLSFNNQYLLQATETNIKHSHSFYQENVLLYLSTKGTAEEKVVWLNKQIDSQEKVNHSNFFSDLKLNCRFNQSGFFIKAFSAAKSYVIFKMLSQPLLAEFQTKLFEKVEINFGELSKIEDNHPLNDYYIDLSFLNSTN